MKPRFIDLVLVASLLSNVAFAYVIHRDRTPTVRSGPKVGQMVGTLTGFDDSEAKIMIPSDAQGRPTVLYVFSQSCVWCERTIPALRSIIPQERARFRFIAVDISLPFSPTKPYLDANGPFEQTIHPDAETRSRLGVAGTPDTIVIDPSGMTRRVFAGALIGSSRDDAQEFLETYTEQKSRGTAR